MLLRAFGGLARDSAVLVIGCGLGRVAFALRFVLGPEGRYREFEICRYKVDFEQAAYRERYPNFEFVWADVYNSYYNPDGSTPAREYRFPYEDESFDVVFAASVFTHMVPENAANYF